MKTLIKVTLKDSCRFSETFYLVTNSNSTDVKNCSDIDIFTILDTIFTREKGHNNISINYDSNTLYDRDTKESFVYDITFVNLYSLPNVIFVE